MDGVEDGEVGAGVCAGGAERIADRAGVGWAQLETVAGIDLDCVHEPAADELGAGDQRDRSADVLLQEMEAVDRGLVIRTVEVIAQRVRGPKQPNAEPLAAAVRLEDQGAGAKALPCSLGEQFLAGDEDSVRRSDAGGFEGGVLARLADLEVERAAAVDDAPLVLLEPGQHRGGQLGGVAMVARVRGGAHPIIEGTVGRRPRQIEDAAIEKPVAPGKRLPVERSGQRFEPGRVLVDHVDMRHPLLLGMCRGNYTVAESQRPTIYMFLSMNALWRWHRRAVRFRSSTP